MPGDPNQNTNGLTSLPPQAPVNTGNNGSGYNAAFSPAQAVTDLPGDQTGGKMPVSAGQTYGGIYGQAQGMSNYFNNAASQYNQTSPQIGDQARLGQAADYYTQLMQGDGGYAQRQYMQNADQSIASQMAMANSARGGAATMAGAQRAAQMGAGAQMATAANQAGQIASQEEQQGAQGLQGIGQLDLQRAQNNAQLQQNNQQQINQMQQSLYGMGEQEQGLGLSAQQAYMANLLAAEGINTQQSQFNTNLGMQVAGAGLQTLGAVGGIAASDANMKTGIQPAGGVGSGSSGLTSAYAGSAMGAAPSSNANLTSIYSHALNTQPQAIDPNHQDNATAAGTGAGIGAATGALSGAASGGAPGAILGAAGGAASGGLGAAAKAHPQDEGLKTANVATQAGTGAVGGALAGAPLGPWGSLAGGVIGGAAGLIKGLMT